ncbi:Citrate transporter [uncultured archaeon]|nr:Citrate transporter [uncultured archaeon]
MIALIVLGIVLALIAVRQVGRFSIPIYLAMLAGALAVLLFGAISFGDAILAMNFEVLLFLFGMFVLCSALEASGLLEEATNRILCRAASGRQLMLLNIALFAFGSALLVNDSMAVVAAPMLVYLSLRLKVDPKPLLYAACFAITLGAMATPIGNPQNLLIALESGMADPFGTFARYLVPPALISLAVLFALSKAFWPRFWKSRVQKIQGITMIRDRGLAQLSAVAVCLFALLLLMKWLGAGFALWMVAMPPALLLLAASRRRLHIARKVDWPTLIFFAAMFVLMQAVWNEGAVQKIVNGGGQAVSQLGSIIGITIVASQFISNLPLVALYLPLLSKAGAGAVSYVALAGAASMAGNLTIMGAASNVILVEAARRRGVEISFWEFSKFGIIVTLASTLILSLWLGIAG